MLTQRAIDDILMDVAMPIMDGNEATRRIRAAESRTRRHIPIIGISAHTSESDVRTSLESGMDVYLPKPIDSRKLFEALALCGRLRSPAVATL
jgi:CheY-like chemotaxis protein